MSFYKFSKLLIFTLSTLAITTNFTFAKFKQLMLPVNDQDKKVTFTFYYFDSSRSTHLVDVTDTVGKITEQLGGVAGISASAQANFTFKSGRFIFQNPNFLIKDGAIINSRKPLRNTKHTFILTDGKKRHAICYSPVVSKNELQYALLKLLTSSKGKLTSAVIIDSGSQCSFYKTNGKYLPYYLKELKKPAKALIVK